MREVNFDELDGVSGGVSLGALPVSQQQQEPAAGFTFDPTQQGQFQGLGQGMFPGFGGMEHGGFHEGRMAMREFIHDPTFQGALQQFEAQHPELAQALAPLNEAGQQGGGFHHPLGAVMHDPNGRAALNQLLGDQTFQAAVQQYSATHADIAGPLQGALARLDARLDNPNFGQGFGGHHGFGPPGFGPPGFGPPGFGPPDFGPGGMPPFGGAFGAPQGGPSFGSPLQGILGQNASPFGGAPVNYSVQGTPNGYSYQYTYGAPAGSPLGAASPLGGGAVAAGTLPT